MAIIQIEKQKLTKEQIEKQILENLSKDIEGKTISQLAKEIGLSPPCCSKYTLYLEGKGLIKRRKIGNSYLITPKA